MRAQHEVTSNDAGSSMAAPATPEKQALVPAGHMSPWEVDTLDAAPAHTWRNWTSLIGPGVLLAGSSIGAGEWLFGPAVSAQFGGTFLWLATISIVTQTFYNLEVMRYTLYCGEPIFVGFFRVSPGPRFWTGVYLILCIAHIWPFMASNAAVPVSAAILGHLPGDAIVPIGPIELSEKMLVKVLGYVIFVLAIPPLIFGGKIYNVLERMMTVKLVIVLGFLVAVTAFLISPYIFWEVGSGFFRFGQVAIRAETVIADMHFNVTRHETGVTLKIAGTIEKDRKNNDIKQPFVAEFSVDNGTEVKRFKPRDTVDENLVPVRTHLLEEVTALVKPGRFLVETAPASTRYHIEGSIAADQKWQADRIMVIAANGEAREVQAAQLAKPDKDVVEALVANQGFERVGMFSYALKNGHFPVLDWTLLASFAAIAGAGMLSNALFSNYARDKGWGMGAKTGAIPSAIGGRTVTLSHVGKVFVVDDTTFARWRGWFRHIMRDQIVWTLCSVVGLALPCMLSLQFIRNAPVSGDRVAALTADGLASRFPEYANFWWLSTLFVSFILLAPNAVFGGDLIARLWTDLIWIGSSKAKDQPGHRVMRVYYTILAIYAVWGLIVLAFLDPLQIAKVGAVLGNVALGFSAFHTLYVNKTLLPKRLQPNWIMQLGLIACGVFFLAITAITVYSLM